MVRCTKWLMPYLEQLQTTTLMSFHIDSMINHQCKTCSSAEHVVQNMPDEIIVMQHSSCHCFLLKCDMYHISLNGSGFLMINELK